MFMHYGVPENPFCNWLYQLVFLQLVLILVNNTLSKPELRIRQGTLMLMVATDSYRGGLL
jgi:hypothetical protein